MTSNPPWRRPVGAVAVGGQGALYRVRPWLLPADRGFGFGGSHDLGQRPVEVVGGPYRWARSLELLDGEGIPVGEYPQSPARMGPATSRLYAAVVDRLLSHDGDPRLARHVANAVVKEDSRGARLAKKHKDSRRRIDAAVAAVMAHDRAAVRAGDRGPSIYV